MSYPYYLYCIKKNNNYKMSDPTSQFTFLLKVSSNRTRCRINYLYFLSKNSDLTFVPTLFFTFLSLHIASKRFFIVVSNLTRTRTCERLACHWSYILS